MKIRTAHFITSAADPNGFPPPLLPEVCFAGRSNVGKSSLLNVLMERKRLVQVSSKPGRTQLVNFFDVNGDLVLVDLPGYGYARLSKGARAALSQRIEDYLNQREILKACVLLVDIRRGPEEEEAHLLEHLRTQGTKAILVATKTDKVSKTARGGRVQSIADRLGVPPRTVTPFSATTRQGREQLWKRIVAAIGDSPTPPDEPGVDPTGGDP